MQTQLVLKEGLVVKSEAPSRDMETLFVGDDFSVTDRSVKRVPDSVVMSSPAVFVVLGYLAVLPRTLLLSMYIDREVVG